MAPAIGRSIRQGFQTANRSWLGIGFLVACWIAAWLLAVGMVAVTRMPRELLQPPESAAERAEVPLADDATTLEDDAPRAGQDATTRWMEIFWGWVGRAWPVLLLVLLCMVSLGLWLQGGQIGYVAQHVRTAQASLPDFWRAGTKAFVPLLGTWGIGLAAGIVLTLMGALAVWLLALLGAVAGWLAGLVGVVAGVAAVAGLVWLGVKLVFWYIAVVVDGAGPINGLKRSFHLTRGYWLPLFGLGVILGLISFGLQVGFGLVEGVGGLAGGLAATVFSVLSNVLGAVANLYLGFFGIAAFVRFYEDIKASGGSAATAAAPGSSAAPSSGT